MEKLRNLTKNIEPKPKAKRFQKPYKRKDVVIIENQENGIIIGFSGECMITDFRGFIYK